MLRARISSVTNKLYRPCSSVTGVSVTPLTEARLRGHWSVLDRDADRMLAKLTASEAPLVWHKHGTFFEHLRDVWVMLCAWEQPEAICRLGLFHSAYSNSFVSMGVFDRERDRAKLAALVGDEAEQLIYKFCTIDRQSLESTVLSEGTIRAEGCAWMRLDRETDAASLLTDQSSLWIGAHNFLQTR